MDVKKIKSIFKQVNIEIKEIKSATNSFNSNVFIIKSDDNKKYVLKFCNNEKKMINESKYMIHLKKYVLVSNFVTTGVCDNKYYIIQTFLDGENIYDEEVDKLNNEQIKNIGILLAKIHSCPLIDDDDNYWIDYLNNCLDKTGKTLEEIFGVENNNKIINYLRNYIEKEISKNFRNSILHMDFRIGNLMFGNKNQVGVIDLESMKNGDNVFDFVKINRLLNEEQFRIFFEGYESIKKVENNFENRINFYSLFDSYTSLWWCISKKQTDTDFYKINYEIVIKYIKKLKEIGEL